MPRQRKRKGRQIHGWLILNKPLDMTSTQAVSRIKRLYHAQKAGHGGTLDPLADGVLPIALGEATKTSQWAMDGVKDYIFSVAIGRSTSTLDAEGETVGTSPNTANLDLAARTLAALQGEIHQVPPKFSAIKIDGARAYDLAREGEDFQIKSRPVMLYEAELLDTSHTKRLDIRVVCGKGFYVRALARDLMAALQTEGHVSALRRTRVGPFTLEKAVSFEILEAGKEAVMAQGDTKVFAELDRHLCPLQAVLQNTPQIHISAQNVGDIRLGRAIAMLPHQLQELKGSQAEQSAADDRLALAIYNNLAIAMGEVRAGKFQPSRVFQIYQEAEAGSTKA